MKAALIILFAGIAGVAAVLTVRSRDEIARYREISKM